MRKIGIIGTGKIAVSFAGLLLRRGYKVGLYGRTEGAAVQAAARASALLATTIAAATLSGAKAPDVVGTPVVFSTSEELIDWCDAVGFVITDDAIAAVAAAQRQRPDRIAFHMSGSLSTTVFEDRESGAPQLPWEAAFSLHPLGSFARPSADFDRIFFALEQSRHNSDEANRRIEAFVRSLEVDVVRLRSDQKVLYHASAVIASNLMVSLMNCAIAQLRAIGIDREDLLWPLVDTTIDNMKRLGARSALTGPVARGDVGTVESHLNALAPNDRAIYCELSLAALPLSHAAPEQIDLLYEVLRAAKKELREQERASDKRRQS